jgi:hypothetical protein
MICWPVSARVDNVKNNDAGSDRAGCGRVTLLIQDFARASKRKGRNAARLSAVPHIMDGFALFRRTAMAQEFRPGEIVPSRLLLTAIF